MDIESAYQDTLNYLYRFVDYSLTRSFRYSPEKFDLERMRTLAGLLGGPQDHYPILHVAGTKGKGSISALCASALQAEGYSVGLYTSPHLQDYAERIQVNGEAIPHADMVALVDEIKPVLEQVPEITTFEITTALALLYFARRGATAVVLEVGLGGRLDATNIVTPKVAVITSISYDHTDILGNTLEKIAAEKAGIIKSGVPVVSSPQKEAAQAVIERIAAERQAPLTLVGREYRYQKLAASVSGQTLQVWRAADGSEGDGALLTIPLLGNHQVENAATAYTALQSARENGLRVGEAAIQQGFSQVVWPARFEILRREPPLIIDAAHNRDSALRLRQALDEYFPGRPVVLIFGASEDKDVAGMFVELAPRVETIIATRSYHPRAMEPQDIVRLAEQYGRSVRVVDRVEDALEEALRLAADRAVILATGSVFVAAGVRHSWHQAHEQLEDSLS